MGSRDRIKQAYEIAAREERTLYDGGTLITPTALSDVATTDEIPPALPRNIRFHAPDRDAPCYDPRMKPQTIDEFQAALSPEDRVICDLLRHELDDNLPGADSKLWHAHPVWFLKGNPIAGYARLKDSIRLLFWSGQSFTTPGLQPEGSFKAAEIRFTRPDQIDLTLLRSWLTEAQSIQWDYKNIVKRKGHLERIL